MTDARYPLRTDNPSYLPRIPSLLKRAQRRKEADHSPLGSDGLREPNIQLHRHHRVRVNLQLRQAGVSIASPLRLSPTVGGIDHFRRDPTVQSMRGGPPPYRAPRAVVQLDTNTGPKSYGLSSCTTSRYRGNGSSSSATRVGDGWSCPAEQRPHHRANAIRASSPNHPEPQMR
jgi:hypothetical protein